LLLASLSSLTLWNSLAYWADSSVTKKIKCFEYGSWDGIHNTLFSSKLTNRPNKLECLSLSSLSSLVLWNSLAHWADLSVTKKNNYSEYHRVVFTAYFFFVAYKQAK
jgi:hypothetical protein